MAAQAKACRVSGTVRANGAPVRETLLVRVFDQDLRKLQQLAEVRTDRDGRYEAEFELEAGAAAEIGRLDLVAVAYEPAAAAGLKKKRGARAAAADEGWREVGRAGPLFDATTDATLDIEVRTSFAAQSEFARLTALLTTLLDGQDVALTDLRQDDTHQDIDFLVAEARESREALIGFVLAARLKGATKIRADFHYALAVEGGFIGVDPSRPASLRLSLDLETSTDDLARDEILAKPETLTAIVQRAVRRNRVDASLLDALDDILKALGSKRPAAEKEDAARGREKLLAVLGMALDGDLIERAKGILTERKADGPERLLALLHDEMALPKAAAGRAEAALTIARLAGHDPDAVAAVKSAYRIDTAADLHRLAAAPAQEIAAAALTRGAAKPTRAQSAAATAAVARMKGELNARFPTAAFAGALLEAKAAPLGNAAQVSRYLTDHAGFDLVHGDIRAQLKDAPPSRRHGKAEALRRSLEAGQRVLRLAPDAAQAGALLEAGMTSAHAVTARGEAAFVSEMTERGAMSADDARRTYGRARYVRDGAVALAGELRALGEEARAPMHALGGAMVLDGFQTLQADFPDLQALFGGGDFCACEQCRSVWGPAAYLVDVLAWIQHRKVRQSDGSVGDAWKALIDRRPDLLEIDLDCANAETELPYVDVVCELLENLVHPDPGVLATQAAPPGALSNALKAELDGLGVHVGQQAAIVGPRGPAGSQFNVLRDAAGVWKATAEAGKTRFRAMPQSLESSAALKAAPAYVNRAAYGDLKAAPHAFTLPFDLDLAEARGWLGGLDSSRAELMATFGPGGAAADEALAGERLGMTDLERRLVTGATVAPPAKVWKTDPASPQAALKKVSDFQAAAELSFDEVQALIAAGFVNPLGAVVITRPDPDPADPSTYAQCDTSKMMLETPNAAFFDRAHRFLRLRRRLGWPIDTLDHALHAPRLGAQALSGPAVTRLSDLARLQAMTGASLSDLMVLFGELDTAAYDTLFQRRPASPALAAAAVRANEALPAADPNRKTLAARQAEIAAALGLDAATAASLIAAATARAGSAVLTRRGLAEVAAPAVMARLLGLTVADSQALLARLGANPFATPAAAIETLARAARLAAFGLTGADLDHLLAFAAPDSDARGLSDTAAGQLLAVSGRAAAGALNEASGPLLSAADAAAAYDELNRKLSETFGLSAALLGGVQALHDGQANANGKPAALFVTDDLAPKLAGSDLDADVLAAPIEAARAAVVAAANPGDKATAQAALRLALYTAREVTRALAVAAGNALESQFRLASPAAAVMLNRARLRTPAVPNPPRLARLLSDRALAVWTGTTFAAADATTAAFATHRAGLRMARQAALAVERLKMTDGELDRALADAAGAGWTALDALPYAAGQPAAAVGGFERLLTALSLARGRPAVADPANSAVGLGFFEVLETALPAGATLASILGRFAAWSGHGLAMLTALDTRFGLSAADLTAYARPETYARLDEAATLARRTRLTLAQVDGLLAAEPDQAAVAAAREALKAGLPANEEGDDSAWLGRCKQIYDPIRRQKRDALVAWVLANDHSYRTPDDLFDHFLMDVQMQPCGQTSRIVAAHGTVQLFVERCRLGLEADAIADVELDPDWDAWQWMRNYRVWEANRKIFVYPENWIDPELRDDDSELFDKLQDTLQQGDLTAHDTESAAEDYLAALDAVSFLEVVACHYRAPERTMHVLARTRGGDPAVYYHRQRVKERSWTPWRKVDLEIGSDQILMFSRDNRLYVAWLVLSEEADKEQTPAYPGAAPAKGTAAEMPRKQWKAQISVSEYDGKRWLPPRLSRDALTLGWYRILPSRSGFRLFAMAFNDPADLVKPGETPADILKVLGRITAADTQLLQVLYIEDGTPYWGGKASKPYTQLLGVFSLIGCKGYPEIMQGYEGRLDTLPTFTDTDVRNMRFREIGYDAMNDLTMLSPATLWQPLEILHNTPDEWGKPATKFGIAYPFQTSLLDLLIYIGELLLRGPRYDQRATVPLGTFMPFFFEDGRRAYSITPEFYQAGEDGARLTITHVLTLLEDIVDRSLYYGAKIVAAAGDPAKLDKIAEEYRADPRIASIKAQGKAFNGLTPGYRFDSFQHPLVCAFRSRLSAGGIPAVMTRETQRLDTGFRFEAPEAYAPTPAVEPDFPREIVDFDPRGAYSGYNWELFFHLPYLVALRLMRRQRFEEAQRWFHYVFDPIGAHPGASPGRYWVTRPFADATPAELARQRIEAILYGLAADPESAANQATRDAIDDWRHQPFRPHLIARTRPLAYQKAIVFAYVDNLVAWGDSLFRQYTTESVNQARQFYILAGKILGPRPQIVPPPGKPLAASFAELAPDLDAFGNAMAALETYVPPPSDTGGAPGSDPVPATGASLRSPYFCIPPNDKSFASWDIVADRLAKIRSCRNIDGEEVPLSLFAPTIDPGALVRAAAAGLDIGAVMAGFGAPLPYYRFQVLAQKATDLAQEARNLSGALLGAIEKRDGEALSRLRAEHELALLNAMLDVRRLQLNEADQQIKGLEKQIETVTARRDYYRSRTFISPGETVALALNTAALVPNTAAMALHIASAVISLVPNFQIGGSGFGGSPHVSAHWGSQNLTGALGSSSAALSAAGGLLTAGAGIASTLAGYERRMEEWSFQQGQADHELKGLAEQLEGARIRRHVAEVEIANQGLQIRNSQAVGDFLHSKFSDQELYEWTIGRLSGVTNLAYQLALDMARKAERCFRHELGTDQYFVGAGHWDGLHKGLTASDLLIHDIKRMEAAYLDENRRDLELSQDISLAEIDPEALAELKRTGACFFSVPEAIFDVEHSGHYMRRLKTVGISMPCVAGPYATVGVKMSLVQNRYRRSTALKPGASEYDQYTEVAAGDDRFVYATGGVQAMVTSRALNDSGLFEVNLRDERYLPFEGAGAVGLWRVELTSPMPSFDRMTISDLVLHVRYTARDGGSTLKTKVDAALTSLLKAMKLSDGGRSGLWRAVDLRRDRPAEWDQLISTGATALTLTRDNFPLMAEGKTITLKATRWLVQANKAAASLDLKVDATAVPMVKQGAQTPPLFAGDAVAAPALATAMAITTTQKADLAEAWLLVRYELS